MSTTNEDAHLVPLPGGDWALWNWVCLRGAGFEANFVLQLAAPETARLLDALLDAEEAEARARDAAFAAVRPVLDQPTPELRAPVQKALKRLRKGQVPEHLGFAAVDAAIDELRGCCDRREAARAGLPASFAAATERNSASVRETAADPRFREALTWQNRSALSTALDPLLRHTGASGSKDRRNEKLIASYLQRYCTKNDTIGFFGPIGWAKLSSSSETLDVRPGAGLLARRSVHLEQWAVDALAATVARDPRVEPYMAPRRLSFVRIDGERVLSAMTGAQKLSREHIALLAACDGLRTAVAIADAFVLEHAEVFPDRESVFVALRDLREKKLVAWTLEVPLMWNPEAELRRRLGTIGDAEARKQAIALLDDVERARDDVGARAGDAEALGASLVALDETFTRVTGAAATRHAGSMYAARGIVFEDCQRDVHAELGPRILEAVGPALSLVLASGRWMTCEVAAAYKAAFEKVHADVAKRAGTSTVPFSDVWLRFQRVLFGTKDRPIEGVLTSLQQRWSEILSFPADARRVHFTSDELRDKVGKAFAAPGPGWREARHHSPDLMIAAPSIEAVNRGEYEVVLGEMHVGINTLDAASFVAQHPQPEELLQALESDVPGGRVIFVPSKEWPKITVRTSQGIISSQDWFLETGFDSGRPPHDRILKMSDLVLEDAGGHLVIRSQDRRVELGVLDCIGDILSTIIGSTFKMLPRANHLPRMTIDRLVVNRESWSFLPSELTFDDHKSELEVFEATRRWARAVGLPRFFYVKATIEVKPLYVDLDSPMFVGILGRLVKRVREHVSGETALLVTEMIPAMDQLWLTGTKGEVYTSEMRVVARDPQRPPKP